MLVLYYSRRRLVPLSEFPSIQGIPYDSHLGLGIMQQFPLMFRIMLLFLCLLGIMTIPYSVFGYAIRKHSIFLLHRPSIIILH